MICNVANQGTVNTQLNGNTTAYTYYQMLYVSGSNNANPYWQEIEFSEGGAVGTSAIYFGSGNSHQNWLEVPGNHAGFNFGAGNFTIEWWSKFLDTGNNRGFMYFSGNSGATNGVYINKGSNNKYTCNMYSTGSPNNLQVDGTVTVDDGAWHHNAFVRNGNVWTLYTDGNAAGTFTGSGYAMPAVHSHADAKFTIGSVRPNHEAASEMSGYLDEIRISTVARYTANFTPSTTPFTTDSNTVLLLHGDGTGQIFTDDSYAAGKQTQLHGWAVNY